ncbi:MAG: hypothetical protein AB1546_09710 [bacterium]
MGKKGEERKVIYIISAGDLPASILEYAKRKLPVVFGLPVKVMYNGRLPEGSFHPMRNQYDAIPIIKETLRQMPDDAEKALTITDVDLFIPCLTHIIGEAQLGGKAGVVSAYRLKHGLAEDEMFAKTMRRRVLKEVIHELGHTFGLTHCKDFLCPMSVSADGAGVDRKGISLCRSCRFLLEMSDRDVKITS